MRAWLVLIIPLLWALHGSAQDDVTLAELEEKFYPADSTAGAVFLYSKGTARIHLAGFQWQLVTTVTNRIKIYKPSGYRYADKEISYLSYKDYGCTVKKSVTYNAEGGKIVKTPLKNSEIYTETLNTNRGTTKLHMPNVKEGSIVEYTYEVISPSIHIFPRWYFQYDVPVKYSDYEVIIPAYFSVNRFMAGTVGINESKPRRDYYKQEEVSVVNYSAQNVPAIKEEPFSPNIDNYLAAVWFEVAGVSYGANQPERNYNTDWQSMSKRLYEDEDFGGQLEITSYFKKDLKALLGEEMAMPQAEKANAIFNMVQQRMVWNGRETYWCRDGVKTAYENKKGTVGEINLMLLAMLKYAGVEAWPVILSTRTSGMVMYPNYSSFDYVVVLAKIDGKEVLLDATSRNVKPGQLPVRALNYKGRLLSETGEGKEVDLTVQQKSKSGVVVMAAIDAAGTVSGKARQTFDDYYGYALREIYNPQEDSLFVAVREKDNPGLSISNHVFKDINQNTKPVTEEYDFVHNGIADVAGDKIYVSPMLFFETISNPFTAAQRQYPVDYMFPFQKKYSFSITIPEGYVAASVPENLRLNLPDQLCSTVYAISATKNVVQFVLTLDVNQSIIDKEYYPQLRDLFVKLAAKQNEKIVLKKG